MEREEMMQQPRFMPEYKEDEIDLRELFATIGRYKKKIALFTFVVVSLVLVYLLATPNSYSSKAVLAPQEQQKILLGDLGALAGMAGFSLGGGQMDAFTSLKTILEDYDFQKYVIEKHHLIDRWYDENLTRGYVFALGFDGLFRLFHFKPEYEYDEETLFKVYEKLLKSVTISSDKKAAPSSSPQPTPTVSSQEIW